MVDYLTEMMDMSESIQLNLILIGGFNPFEKY